MVSSASRTASANAGANAGAIGYTSRLDEYKEAIRRLFPRLPKDTVDAWSISEADILSLGLLLEFAVGKPMVRPLLSPTTTSPRTT